jgi:hypothetical protein
MSVILELPADTPLHKEALEQINQRFLWISKRLQQAAQADASATATMLVGTRSDRFSLLEFAATAWPEGQQFYETDTGLTYLNREVGGGPGLAWYYMAGTATGAYASPLASHSKFIRPLGPQDAGLLFRLTDKARTMQWSGGAWAFAPTEVIPVGYVSGFRADPGAGWHICDGSGSVSQLNSDGTTSSITVEDFASAAAKAAYPKWGSSASGFAGAVKPVITGSTAAQAVSISGSTANADAFSAGTTTGVSAAPSTIHEGGGAAATVSADAHQHSIPAGTHSHGVGSLAGASHTHGVGSLVNDDLGEPRHYGLIAYQRV